MTDCCAQLTMSNGCLTLVCLDWCSQPSTRAYYAYGGHQAGRQAGSTASIPMQLF
jgi:hypothetical protein